MQTKNCEAVRKEDQDRPLFRFRGLADGIAQSASTAMLACDGLMERLKELGVDTEDELLRLHFQSILQSAMQQSRTSENLIDAAAAFRDELCPEVRCVELVRQLKKTTELCRPSAQAGGIALSFESLLPEGELLMTDPRMMDKILLNLLSNAMRAGNRVEIRLFRKEALMLTVTDNGPGLPKEVQEHLFEPAVTDRLAFPGAHAGGLGLHLVREYCRALGWTVKVDSTPAGTCVALELADTQPGGRVLASRGEDLGFRAEQNRRAEMEMSILEF